MFPFLPFLTFPECGRRKCARRRRRRALDRELNYIYDQNLPGTSAGQQYYVSATYLEPSVLRVKYICAVPKYSRISEPAPLELLDLAKKPLTSASDVTKSSNTEDEGCEKAIDNKNGALLAEEEFHPQLVNGASKMVTSPSSLLICGEYNGIPVNGIADNQNVETNKFNSESTFDKDDELSDNLMEVKQVKLERDLAQFGTIAVEENGGLSKLTVETVQPASEEFLAVDPLDADPEIVNNSSAGSRRATPSPAGSLRPKTPRQQQVEAVAVVGTPPGERAARARQRAFQPSQAMLEMFGGSTIEDSLSTSLTSQPGPELIEPGEPCEEIEVMCLEEEKMNTRRSLRKKKNSQDIETVAAMVDGGHQTSSPNNNVMAASKGMQLSDPGPELASDEEKEALMEKEEEPKMLNGEALEEGEDEILLKRSLNGGKEDKSAANGFNDVKEEESGILNEEATTDTLLQGRKNSSEKEKQDESMRNGKDRTVESAEGEKTEGECGDAVVSNNYNYTTSTQGDNERTTNNTADNCAIRGDKEAEARDARKEEGVMRKPSQQRALRQHERSSISFGEAPPPAANRNNHDPTAVHGQRKTAVVSPRQQQQKQQQQQQRLRVQGGDKANERLHTPDTTATMAKSRNSSGSSGGKGSVLSIRHPQQQQHAKSNNPARPLAQVSPSPRRNVADDVGGGGGGWAAMQQQKQQPNSGSLDPTKPARRSVSPRFQKASNESTSGGGGGVTFGGTGNVTSNNLITNSGGGGGGSGMMNGTNDDDASVATGGGGGGGVAEGAIFIRQANIINDDEMFVADVLIENGVISRISKSLNVATDGSGVEVVEANGRWLLPAGIDAYTQFTSGATAAGAAFAAGTKAALAGGTGTLIEVVRPKSGETLAAAVDRVLRLADMYAKCHFGVSALVGGEWNSQIRGQMTELVREKGVNSFLLEFSNDAHTFEALEHAKTLGAYCRVLPDNRPILALLEKRQAATPAALAAIRAERVRHFCVFSQLTNAPLSVISVGGVPRAVGTAVHDSRVEGAMVSAEVALPSVADGHSTSASCDDCALELLAEGTLTMCVSGDGGTSLSAQKPPIVSGQQANIGNAIEIRMSALWQRGVIDAARLDPMRFVAVTSSNAAKIFNIYPQKGKVAVGSDADLVLWDFDTAAATPQLTVLAGKVVARDGRYCQVEESGSLSTTATKSSPRTAAAQRPQWFVALPPNSPYLFSVVQLKEKLFNLSMFSAGRSKPEHQTNAVASSRRTSFASSCASAPPANDATAASYDRKPSNASVPATAVASTNRPINAGARNRNIQSTDPPKRSATKVIYPPGGKSTSLW